MPSDLERQTTRVAAPVFAALGDDTRLRLVARLSAKGALSSIATLTAGSRVTRQAVTKHLHVLESAGLARCTRAGREALWELSSRPIDDARAYLDVISSRWDEALGRLKSLVERGGEAGEEE